MDNTDNLFRIIAEILNVPSDTINIDTYQSEVESWDSLCMVNLIVALEQKFELNFDIIEISEMDSVSNIKEVLSSKGVVFY